MQGADWLDGHSTPGRPDSSFTDSPLFPSDLSMVYASLGVTLIASYFSRAFPFLTMDLFMILAWGKMVPVFRKGDPSAFDRLLEEVN
jgi:hypothetical protein